MTWTDERVEQLKKLWSDGLSASQIAAELGGITRNAVIGKVHRLGLVRPHQGAVLERAAAEEAPRTPHAAGVAAGDPRQYCAGAGFRL